MIIREETFHVQLTIPSDPSVPGSRTREKTATINFKKWSFRTTVGGGAGSDAGTWDSLKRRAGITRTKMFVWLKDLMTQTRMITRSWNAPSFSYATTARSRAFPVIHTRSCKCDVSRTGGCWATDSRNGARLRSSDAPAMSMCSMPGTGLPKRTQSKLQWL